MEKINFVNNQTPASATTMNTFQNNIEKAINGVEQKLKGTVLWTNNDSTVDFANQTISINLNNYSYYEIYYKVLKSENFYAKTGLIKKGNSTILSSNLNSSGIMRIATRKISFQSTGSLSVSIGEYITVDGSLTTNNGYLIPVEIIGYN